MDVPNSKSVYRLVGEYGPELVNLPGESPFPQFVSLAGRARPLIEKVLAGSLTETESIVLDDLIKQMNALKPAMRKPRA